MQNRKERDKMQKQQEYRFELSYNDIVLLNRVIEEFMRIRMGQFFDLAIEIALDGYKQDETTSIDDPQFKQYILRKDQTINALKAAMNIAQPSRLSGETQILKKTEKMLIVEDIWAQIRYGLWNALSESEKSEWIGCVDSYPPIHFGSEPAIVCTPIHDDPSGEIRFRVSVNAYQKNLILESICEYIQIRSNYWNNLINDLIDAQMECEKELDYESKYVAETLIQKRTQATNAAFQSAMLIAQPSRILEHRETGTNPNGNFSATPFMTIFKIISQSN